MLVGSTLTGMRATSPEDRQRIIDLYKDGMTRPAIARESGWSVGTVDNIIRTSGIVGAGRVTGIRISPETEAQILALYEQGTEWAEIARLTGRTEKTITNVLKRNGVAAGRKADITGEDRESIRALYQGGMDAPEIGRRVGCSTSAVYCVLDEAGIGRRERVACENPGFFDVIDTPEKAYWLGFIGADGCVTGLESGNQRLQIKLARKDRGHLDLLHEALKANRPVRDDMQMSKGQMRPYSTLTVYSQHIYAALVSHGVTPRKSATLEPWDGPATLMPHYWRGIIDGDGSITINDRGVYVSLVGSEQIVRKFLAWAHGVCGTNSTARQGTKGNRRYWLTQVGGVGDRWSGVTRLIAALYDDAPVALARKKALADLAVHGKPLQSTMF